MSRLLPINRLTRKSKQEGDCRLWTGSLTNRGYGKIMVKGKPSYSVHRLAYEIAKGPIPDNLEIDHLCNNKRCINPAHLETVTHAENIRRGFQHRRASLLTGTNVTKKATHVCTHCGYSWTPHNNSAKRCSNPICRSPNWDKPRKWYRK